MEKFSKDWRNDIYDVFKDIGISLVSHVPDAGHTPLIDLCEKDNNIYTGRIEDPPSLGEGKLKNVQVWMKNNGFLNFNGTTFYSDSILDMPLLEKVEKPVAVNPDNDLLRVSKDFGWEIIDLPI